MPEHGLFARLPLADTYGNFWFCEVKNRGDVTCPCILTRKANKKTERVAPYMVSLGPAGVLWDGNRIREFTNPRMALQFVQEMIDAGVYVPTTTVRSQI